MKKLLTTMMMSALILGACENEEPEETPAAEEETVEAEEISEEEGSEENSEEHEEEEDVELVEEETDDDLPEQQVGDIIEAEGGIRTVVATNYGINETQENGPFDVTLKNVQVSHLESEEEFAELLGGEDLAMVSFQVEVTNNSEDTNIIYPGQGTMVTDGGDQVDAELFLSDDVGGDFLGEVTKEGDVFFLFDGDPEDIENVRYIIRSGHGEDFESFGEDIEFSVDF